MSENQVGITVNPSNGEESPRPNIKACISFDNLVELFHNSPCSIIQVDKISGNNFSGPLPETNWVIPGRLMVGSFPASHIDSITYSHLGLIMREGVGTFVCLQQEFSEDATEMEWKSQMKLRPYFSSVEHIYSDGSLWSKPQHIKPSCIEFIHFPIRDGSICNSDQDLFILCRRIVEIIDQERGVYIHCLGGHGRTGVVSSIILSMIYRISPELSMKYIQLFHDCRKETLGGTSPQTHDQRSQVIRIVNSDDMKLYHQDRFRSNNSNSNISKNNKSPFTFSSQPKARYPSPTNDINDINHHKLNILSNEYGKSAVNLSNYIENNNKDHYNNNIVYSNNNHTSTLENDKMNNVSHIRSDCDQVDIFFDNKCSTEQILKPLKNKRPPSKRKAKIHTSEFDHRNSFTPRNHDY